MHRQHHWKSFIALDIAEAVATGSEWMGYKVPKKGAVLYIAGERDMAVWAQGLRLARYRTTLQMAQICMSSGANQYQIKPRGL
jgi:RecA-family ATPase